MYEPCDPKERIRYRIDWLIHRSEKLDLPFNAQEIALCVEESVALNEKGVMPINESLFKRMLEQLEGQQITVESVKKFKASIVEIPKDFMSRLKELSKSLD